MKELAIIGGDARIVTLAKMLAKEEIQINTYALEQEKTLNAIPNIKQCNSIQEAIKTVNTVIGPIPLSNSKSQINTPFSTQSITLQELVEPLEEKQFLAGNIPEEFYEQIKRKNVKVIDLLKCEELVVLNTIATAEGAIQIAIEETTKTIHGSNILVLGFGRVGKTVANTCKAMGARVYCGARKNEDFAWMKVYGYKIVQLTNLKKELNKFDIIINTIPTLILKQEELTYVKTDCLLIDLASKPGGIDQEAAKKRNLKTIWALALPGKVAPQTSAEYIKNTIYHILEEK